MPIYQGTPGDDNFVGTSESDFFFLTPSGHDVAAGGAGLDRFQLAGTAGVGSAAVYGEAGRDEFVINDFGLNFTVSLYGGADADLFQLQGGIGTVVDAGDGADVINMFSGSATVTFGAGQDIAILQDAVTSLIIQDFTISGTSADRLDLAEFIAWNNSTQAWNGVENPFNAGYLRLRQSGADALIEYGNGFGYQTLVTLKGVTATDLTALNLGGFDPAGGASVGSNVTGHGAQDDLRGLAGHNVLDGAGGDDTVTGGAGTDQLFGGAGDDIIRDNRGASVDMWGGEGADTLVFNRSGIARPGTAALLNGGAGADTITAVVVNASYNGAITLQGGDGDDQISLSGAAAGVLEGGAGDDWLSGGDAGDALDGGDGTDTVSFEGAAPGVRATLGVALSTSTGTPVSDSLIAIENLVGSSSNDALGGDSGANVLIGGSGNDEIWGGAGDDTIFGDDDGYGVQGDDILDGGEGVDTVSYLGATTGVVVSLALTGAQNTLGGGSDTLAGFERLVGSFYDDVLTGDGGANVIFGGSGVDTLNGGGGDDILIDSHSDGALNGGDGTDTVTFADSTNDVQVDLANTGLQQVVGSWGYRYTFNSIENLVGSRFDDRLTGNALTNTLQGGEGDDILDGGDGADTLDGGAGRDTASYASATSAVNVSLSTPIGQPAGEIPASTDTFISVENVIGSAFNDALKGDGAANVLTGGGGRDILFGEGGDDTLFGGDEEDNIFAGLGDDYIDGGAGVDTANYSDLPGTSGATTGVVIDLRIAGAQNTVGAGVDTFVSIGSLVGTQFADI